MTIQMIAAVVTLVAAYFAALMLARSAAYRAEHPVFPAAKPPRAKVATPKEPGWGLLCLETVARILLGIVLMWSVSGPIDVRIDKDH